MYRHMVEPKLPPFIPNAIGVAIEPEVNAKALEFRAADVNGTVNIAKVNADNAEATKRVCDRLNRVTLEELLNTSQPIPSAIEDPNNESTIKGESDDTTQRTRHQIGRLTESQRMLLVDTFTEVEHNAVKNGLKMLVKLFSDYPEYKQIWPQFRAIPDSSLMNAIQLRRHASVYMCGLGAIIHSMKHENDLAVQINRIAKAHIKWNVHRMHIVVGFDT